ncbi:MAG: hypothetical protein OCD76_07415 [Reichenbachiella sp.]
MSAEVASITALLKYLWAVVFVPAGAYLFNQQRKAGERLTVLETKGEQTKETLQENTEATKELTILLTQLRIDIASMDTLRKPHE